MGLSISGKEENKIIEREETKELKDQVLKGSFTQILQSLEMMTSVMPLRENDSEAFSENGKEKARGW